MTTVQPGFDNISSVDMSYDEINFASRLGDDDIDIDIDLETGPNDEDYILEDVNSDDGNGDTLINNDDVMIDDENISYQMDDVEVLHHEHIEMEDADLSDRPAIGLSNLGTNVSLAEDSSHFAAALDEGHETILDVSRSHETHLEDVEAKHIPIGQILTDNNESSRNEIINASLTHSPPTALQQNVPGIQAEADQHVPISYPSYNQPSSADTEEQDPIDVISTSENAPVGLVEDENKIKSGESNSIALGADRVVVTYQDMEYALFSTSESDDPDTFFLKDENLINGSLGDLLAELRSIIHEDLALDDELCLAIEDLGIEISETCISVYKITFASVIDLHQRLLRNDGLETPSALHITLSIKPDFAKRLASLATGAAAGKGKSDLILWDESSEVLEEDEKPLHIEGGVSSDITDQNAEAEDESTEILGHALVSDVTNDEKPPEDNKSNQNVGEMGGKVETPTSNNRDQISDFHEHSAVSGNGSPREGNQGQQIKLGHESDAQEANIPSHTEDDQNHNEDEDEDEDEEEEEDGDGDGDLIDYEDEEYELIRETSNPIIDSNVQANEDNFAPDTYFLPPTTEEDVDETQTKIDAGRDLSAHSGQDPRPDTGLEADNNPDPFSELQYLEEHENDEDFEQDGEESHISYDDEEKDSEEGGDVNFVSEDASTNVEESFNPLEPDHEAFRAGTTEDDAEELDYGTTGQDLTDIYPLDYNTQSFVGSQKSKTLAVSGGDHDADEIGYEEENILDSNESEHTLIADQSGQDSNVEAAGIGRDDEINYESDPQEDVQSHSHLETTADTSPTSNGFSGKRQRGDADDATERTLKQSKRARS